jgi:flagella basal body P-ring formation protein FlgA
VLRAQGATGVADSSPALITVATRRLPRGTVLRAADFTSIPVVRARTTGGISPVVSEGWVTRRVIRPGEELRPPAVTPASLVSAGQPIQFVYASQGIELVVPAVAMAAASLGGEILVRLGANRRSRGVVIAPGRVVARDPRNPS